MRRFMLVLLALLLALPVLAEDAPAYFRAGLGDTPEPVFSRDALALQRANQALEAIYGLTPHLLGLFDPEISHYGEVSVVRYLPRSRPHPSLTGEYLVFVDGDDTQAIWTHDGVDPALWQSGDLTSPAWGAPQLTAYLLAGSFDREYFDQPYIPADAQRLPLGEPLILSSRTGQLTGDEIALPSALAREAIQMMYSLSGEERDALHLMGVELLLYADGSGIWSVAFYHDGTPDEINYNVLIDMASTEILLVTTFTGGIG